MEAIVLAGGRGSRLQSVVWDRPKPMALVNSRPFLEIVLNHLIRHGFDQIIISVGYMADVIVEFFGDEYKGAQILYSFESEPLGTGGALRKSLALCQSEYVLCANGDSFVDANLELVFKFARNHCESVLVGKRVEDTSRFGRLDLFEGRTIGFTEKGLAGPGFINTGCYVIRRSRFMRDSPQGSFSLESDYLTLVAKSVGVLTHVTNGAFIDIGVPEDFFRAGHFFIDNV